MRAEAAAEMRRIDSARSGVGISSPLPLYMFRSA
jgi:hypothetical protein